MMRMKTRLITLMGSLLLTSLAQAAPSYLMWHEWSAWSPGKPSRAQQFVIQDDGSAQFAEFVDDKLLRLADFSYPEAKQLPRVMDEFLKLDSHYQVRKTPHRVVEGRGDKTWLFVSAQGQRKHVQTDLDLQPRVMFDFRYTLSVPSGGHSGSFVSVRLMPDSFRPDTADLAQMPTLDAAQLQDFPELLTGLNTPFLLVALPPQRWQTLLTHLKLTPQTPYVKTAAGDIAKLVFYPSVKP